jgi:dolichol-phosphate mannosyltransferase
VVGASGVIINMGLLWILKSFIGLDVAVSSPIAIEMSILSNFVLNDIWTWGDRHSRSFLGRLWRYNLSIAGTAFGINYPVLLILDRFFNVNYLIANLSGIILGSIVNFVINHFWTYRKKSI